MTDRRRSRTLLAVLTLVALILITLDYREVGDGPLASLRRGAVIAFTPVQDGFAQVVQPIGDFFGGVRDLADLRGENTALQRRVEDLEARLPSVADLERENRELRSLLAMREQYDLDTMAVQVIGHPPGERGNTVVVDAGDDDGIRTGMAVMTSRGLVGKVVEAYPRYARVELLTSPTAHYAVRVADTGEGALLRGRGGDPFQLEMLDPEATAQEGSEVVTRTFQGSTIPDGLPIGEVVASQGDLGVSPRYQLVRPFVDFRRLSLVQVVLNAPEPPVEFDPDDLIEPPEGERPSPDNGPPSTGEAEGDPGDSPEDEDASEDEVSFAERGDGGRATAPVSSPDWAAA